MRRVTNTVDASSGYVIRDDVTMHRCKVDAKRIALAPASGVKAFFSKIAVEIRPATGR